MIFPRQEGRGRGREPAHALGEGVAVTPLTLSSGAG